MDKKGVRKVRVVLAGIAVIGVFLFLSYIFVPFMNSATVRDLIDSLGIFGPLAIIAYTIIGHIVAPLAGTPSLLVGVSAYGIEKTIVYVYIGSMVSAAINFAISRHFGRKMVLHLVGEKVMKKIDDVVSLSGAGILIVLRIFGIAVFEEISYAAGLTKIRFRSYMTITAGASIIPHVAIIILFKNTDFTEGSNLALLLASLIAVAIIMSLLIEYVLRKKNRANIIYEKTSIKQGGS
jgi:uncharacterized membrane protein YdjX (TVP38/TMEM64 family)